MRQFLLSGLLGLSLMAAADARAAVLQYGYDFTTGTVDGQGNSVLDDSGNGLHAAKKVVNGGGHGGAYSADVPDVALRRFSTGVGSVNTTAGSHQTTANNTIDNADIVGAGGLTFEAWVKPNATFTGTELKQIISESGVVNLSADVAGNNVFFRVSRPTALGGNVSSPNAAIAKNVWTHVAGVIDNVTEVAGTNRINGTLRVYVNGELKGSTDATNLVTGFEYPLTRATAVGNHPTTVTQNFQGLVYEPRISLGALDPTEFTVVVPEPGCIAVLAFAGASLALRRRRSS